MSETAEVGLLVVAAVVLSAVLGHRDHHVDILAVLLLLVAMWVML